MDISSGQVIPGKRRRLACELTEFGVQAFERVRVVSRAHLAGIPQLSFFVESNEKGTEAGPAAIRIGVSGNHELLFIQAFEFQPIGGASRRVNALAILGNNPFPALLACLAKIGFSVRVALLGQPQWIFEPQCLR